MAEPVLRRGSSGTAVRQLQEALKEAGHDPGRIDGEFGPATEAAVRAFQQEKEIAVDGVVGAITWLNIDEDAVFSHPVVRRGSTGLAVRRVQKRLTLAGYDTGGVDGIFGAATETGVKTLQRDSGLTPDGVVGPQTWNAIDALGD
jgi:peptidoglycan hydrolase-like protein with peptidoglycan-binding domain